MPIVKTREYRNLQTLEPNMKEKRIDSEYYVEGFATTFDPYELFEVDGVSYYEQIERNAFIGADMSDVIMQYDHTGRVMARQSNGSLIIEPNDEGLFMCADLSKSDASRSLYEDISQGLVTKMSWAFTVADEEYNRDTRTRLIKRVKKVYDVSAVSIPANDDTLISARSFFDGVIEEEKQELLERRRQLLRIKLKLEE
ncbi:MAG TPA: HK97 family phage prohead protease [Sporosarcina psychrophila]|uniref:HK97 family phage prohead protease n=1 Tax=Sporosarcina psychrophila TaxID=1476 RepID=A0A921G0L0_SPOPS|nr:HK97 family phage prohead protease [Sporosarcina psychrophila]